MKNSVINKKMWKYVDWMLIVLIIVLFLIGLISLVNVTASPFTEDEASFAEIYANLNLRTPMWQVIFFGVGLAVMFLLMLVDYHNIAPYTKWLYLICIALLAAVLLFGSSQRGTTGWFMFGSRGFQPAEICKVIMILVLARVISRQTEGSEEGIMQFRQLLPALLLTIIPVGFIMAQPDFGTAVVYIFIFAAIIFMAKANWKLIGMLVLLVAVLIPLIWLLLEDWQRLRIFTFLDPNYESTDAGLQVAQAKMAIGSGGFLGKGLFAPGSLSQLGYVPEQHNDFIFAATVEAFGFAGGMVVLALYAMLIVRTFMLAMRARDDYGAYIIVGVAAMMLFHVLENIGMNMGLLPVTGIPLPFLSYGGSNLVTSMLAYGMVLSVDMRRGRWKTI
jgi:rod shape determining protein RodA